jgi:ketosteroid isomerase-like protein
MSESLDLVRSIYAAWERGDYSRAEWAHPNIETVVADGPAPGRSTGVAGGRRAMAQLPECLGRIPRRGGRVPRDRALADLGLTPERDS